MAQFLVGANSFSALTPARALPAKAHPPRRSCLQVTGIQFLNQAGVGAICIPCNSARGWFDELAAASAVLLFHIVKASAGKVRKKNPTAQAVGLLSTCVTHQMGVQKNTLEDMGFAVLTPTDNQFDKLVSLGIALIKANKLAEAELMLGKAAALKSSP